jgi:diguanylate cyclase (GGDEF)-like protein/PAS domain S-box-containing protein
MYAPSPDAGGDAFASLAALLDSLTSPVAYADANHRVRYANDAFARAFSASAMTLVGGDLTELFRSQSRKDLVRLLADVSAGQHVAEERELAAIVRGTVWWHIDYYPNRRRSGEVIGYYVFARDISAAKALEVAAAERGAQVRKLVESVMLPMARWDRDVRLVFCNSPYERWISRPRSEIIGKTLAELFGASAWTSAKLSFEKAFSGQPATYERQVRQPRGEARWHRVQVFPDESGVDSPETVFTIAFDIDDDIRLRQQLAANEARLRSVMESIDVPIARFDSELRLKYCNEPYARFAGRPIDAIVGRSIGEIFGEEVAAFVAPQYQRAFAGESIVFDREMRHMSPSKWMRVRLLPDRDASGVARTVVCSVYDVDADVRARVELEAARRRLDEFTNNIPFPLTYLDCDEKYRFANREFLRRHRLDLAQVIGRHPREARGEAIWAQYESFAKKAFAGESASYERPLKLADGTTRWTRTQYLPDVGEDGTVRGIYTTSYDIHELKEAQAEIARVGAKLLTHLASSPVAVIEYDAEGNIVEWSRRAEEIFGYPAAHMLGTRISSAYVHPDDADGVRAVVAQIFAGNVKTITNTHRYLRANGEFVWMEWHTSVLHDATGCLQSVMSLGIDATDRMEARIRLQRLADGIPIPLTYLDARSRYQFMNLAFERWLGIAPAQMIGRTPIEVRGPVLGGLFQSLIDRALQGATESIERLVNLADGRERWIKTLFTPDIDEGGRVVGCYNISFDVHEAKVLEQSLTALARRDELTGAHSRGAFFGELDRMLSAADGSAVALLFIDLDRFKVVNDELGHAVGDQLIRDCVAAIRRCIGAQDLIGRLGGDEFVVVTRVATQAQARAMGECICEGISQLRCGGKSAHSVSASIGIAMTMSRAGGVGSDELVRLADHAMYEAKRAGGSQVRFAT